MTQPFFIKLIDEKIYTVSEGDFGSMEPGTKYKISEYVYSDEAISYFSKLSGGIDVDVVETVDGNRIISTMEVLNE